MQKRSWIITICICSILALLVGVYCILRFAVGIDILDQSGWQVREGQTRYLDYFGRPVKQWHTLEEKTYYFDPDTGALHTGWLEQNGCRYFLGSDGLHTGWLEQDDQLYYLDQTGVMQTGWLTLDDTRYYFDETGAAVSGWMDYEDSRCYLDRGTLSTGWLEQPEGTYFFTAEGIPVTGWLDGSDGKYYFDSDGVMQTGWQEIGEYRYFFREDGSMHTGWLEDSTDRYYFRQDGTMAVGQVDIDGTANFFTSTGKYIILVNRWNFMPEGYMPELVELDGFQVDVSCRDALEQMILDCRAAGYSCYINNTYRSLATQQYMWDVRLAARMAEGMSYEEAVEYTGRSLALVGASEHHLGVAADINGSNGMYDWLGEHCWDYGFILRYPPGKRDITGIIHEPWHFRYVGTELSKELQESGLCLEEYMQRLTESQS